MKSSQWSYHFLLTLVTLPKKAVGSIILAVTKNGALAARAPSKILGYLNLDHAANKPP